MNELELELAKVTDSVFTNVVHILRDVLTQEDINAFSSQMNAVVHMRKSYGEKAIFERDDNGNINIYIDSHFGKMKIATLRRLELVCCAHEHKRIKSLKCSCVCRCNY